MPVLPWERSCRPRVKTSSAAAMPNDSAIGAAAPVRECAKPYTYFGLRLTHTKIAKCEKGVSPPFKMAARNEACQLSLDNSMISVTLLFTCLVTGQDVSAYVYERLELMIGATITLVCDKCSSTHSWPAEVMEDVPEVNTSDGSS